MSTQATLTDPGRRIPRPPNSSSGTSTLTWRQPLASTSQPPPSSEFAREATAAREEAQQEMLRRQQASDGVSPTHTPSLAQYFYVSREHQSENWRDWFPAYDEAVSGTGSNGQVDGFVMEQVRTKTLDDRLEFLREWADSIAARREVLKDLIRRLEYSDEFLEAKMRAKAISSTFRFIRKRIIWSAEWHQALENLYALPCSERKRNLIELLESLLGLPEKSCWILTYRVGYGELESFLERDPGLWRRAIDRHIRDTSIAHLPAWEIPNFEEEERGPTVWDPPPAWRAMVEGTAVRENTRPSADRAATLETIFGRVSIDSSGPRSGAEIVDDVHLYPEPASEEEYEEEYEEYDEDEEEYALEDELRLEDSMRLNGDRDRALEENNRFRLQRRGLIGENQETQRRLWFGHRAAEDNLSSGGMSVIEGVPVER